ncbi:thioesterase domain-containing protein [Streptomyces sp. NPDC001985]|uniref:thioesterase II family protein n=1 Tax=Streptomyces sp. NPDC001985 TaxID=3154406 RepID=UPI0033335714
MDGATTGAQPAGRPAMARRTSGSRWLLRPPAEDCEIRLFCFPYSGCGATMYRNWPERIGRIEVLPLQLPGRENRMREPHFATYERLADDFADEFAPCLDRPFAFFGHCGGALPAFEAVVRLAERGLPAPLRLFVSSQVAPHEGPYGRFLGLSDDQLADELRTLLGALGGGRTPPPQLLELYLEVLVADVEANRKYRKPAEVGIPCPITAIGWDRDAEVPHRLMSGWQDCAPTRSVLLGGEHYTFLDAPGPLIDVFAADLLP